ncbi:FixH family protein [Promicromonospora sp. NFX87]|uniref:FixH family protein n=1 Tax=Promicromonospora sp. NFX87 TaxID=3402691 RepID=UPI003AFA8575
MTTRTRLILATTAVAAVLLGAGLLLVPASAPSEPVVLEADTARHAVRVVVDPAAVGTSEVRIEVGGAADVTRVRLEPAMTQMGHAYPPITAEPLLGSDGSGTYRAEVRFDMSGTWELTVVVDDGHGAQRVTFPLVVDG